MSRPNLLKIDDQLLRMAQLLGLVWICGSLLGIAVALHASVAMAMPLAFVAISATAPIGLYLCGTRLRGREGRAWALHRLVDDHVELSVTALLRDSDFTKASFERAMRDLNTSGVALLVWDRKTNVVQDGRVRTSRVQIDDCTACGAKISMNVNLADIASQRCPYCQGLVGNAELLEEKARLIDTLDADPVVSNTRAQPPSDFSVGLFIFLTLLFWPFGALYAFRKWQAYQGWELTERLAASSCSASGSSS